jgi:hypothetical protein
MRYSTRQSTQLLQTTEVTNNISLKRCLQANQAGLRRGSGIVGSFNDFFLRPCYEYDTNMTYDCISWSATCNSSEPLESQRAVRLAWFLYSFIFHRLRFTVIALGSTTGNGTTGFHMYHDLISRHKVSTKHTLTFPILEP